MVSAEVSGIVENSEGKTLEETDREAIEISEIREVKMNAGKTAISFDKLKGCSNFDEWKISAKSYLVIKGFWKLVNEEVDDDEKNEKAVGEITLMVEPPLYSYIAQTYTSAKKV